MASLGCRVFCSRRNSVYWLQDIAPPPADKIGLTKAAACPLVKPRRLPTANHTALLLSHTHTPPPPHKSLAPVLSGPALVPLRQVFQHPICLAAACTTRVWPAVLEGASVPAAKGRGLPCSGYATGSATASVPPQGARGAKGSLCCCLRDQRYHARQQSNFFCRRARLARSLVARTGAQCCSTVHARGQTCVGGRCPGGSTAGSSDSSNATTLFWFLPKTKRLFVSISALSGYLGHDKQQPCNRRTHQHHVGKDGQEKLPCPLQRCFDVRL